MSSAAPRPTMSRSNSVTIESIGTVGWSVYHAEPMSPFSSAVCETKRIERRGARCCRVSASAISISAIVPLPSSSAPLYTESRRAPEPERIERRSNPRRLVGGRRVRRAVGAARPDDGIVGAQRIVIDGMVRVADMIVVRGDGDELAAEGRIGAGQHGDDVARRRTRGGGVANADQRDRLEVAAAVASRLEAEGVELSGDIVGGFGVPERARFAAHRRVGGEGGETKREVVRRDGGRRGGWTCCGRYMSSGAGGGEAGREEDP